MKTKKCPVCDWEIRDSGIKIKVGGREVVVCCDDCAEKAKENPAKHVGAAA
jgi:ribosome-binding protein aMBF1 (putative translation factor)